MSESDKWLQEIVAELRRPVRLHPLFDRRVMATVRAIERTGTERWSQPRRSLLRPWALAAGLAAVALGTWSLHHFGSDRARSMSAAREFEVVHFVLVDPDASTVTLVGDFNDWDSTATPLRPAADGGVWSVSVPLATGRYNYAFVVNGVEWRADPAAPAPIDDFGTRSSVVTVRAPRS